MSEMKVWSFLMSHLNNAYGTAAVMGNFYIESRLEPVTLQSSYARRMKITSDEYTRQTDSGEYPSDRFVHDGAGYGLAQWTYWSRKQSLLSYAKDKKSSVGDLDTQLEFFWTEVQSYKTVINALKTASSVKEASDIFAAKYERASDTGEEALKRRSDAGQKYYIQFAGISGNTVLITGSNVNLRLGNGKQFHSVARVQKDSVFPLVGTADNGWNALEYMNKVLWVHPDFSVARRT